MLPHTFDAAVRDWFAAHFDAPTPCQQRAWEAIAGGRHTLVAAPTGSGKTLAAFLTALSELAAQARRGELDDRTTVLYVSPLKALSNDVQRNLEVPLQAIRERLRTAPGEVPAIRTAVRTGDTPAAARALMRRRPPHILVTTPESLYILLTSDSGRDMLASVRTVIVDEIHALAGNKRGAHFALSLARLERLTATPPLRIGLSATQRPIERVGEYLLGRPATPDALAIVDEGHVRRRDLAIEMPPSPLETVVSAEVSEEIRERMCTLIEAHRTTLIFVNTRRMAERLARALADRLGEDTVCSHHGSMSRERRLDAEQRLKAGRLRALVATASLELGIDIGDIDLVCQLGATRSLAMLLQRVGRAGHAVGGIAKGRLFPQTRDELLECITLLDMVRRDELDSLSVPPGPRDVLAQHIVAETSCADYTADALFDLVRRAWPYRELPRGEFDAVVAMLGEGFSFAQGRRSAYLHVDAVNGTLRARRGARMVAVTCGGAIPDTADYDVIAEPGGELVGTVNEDFAIESLPGNIFQLGNTAWRVLRVEASALRVVDAAGEPPNMPFWLGEAPARSAEFSHAVSRLRGELAACADAPGAGAATLAARLAEIPGVGAVAARQAAEFVFAAYRALGAMPTQDTLVMERFFDESGGMQLVIHSPFGSRLNKAWGLALRKRFCRTFNFELQAAAIEDAIVISLGAVHSFALDEVWRYLDAASVRDVLVQALLDAPVFNIRWRWVATCALAIQRFRGGQKTPPRLLRMNADDLVSLVFPDQLACAENLAGRREVPDHPLVTQAIDDCLHEAMDVAALEALLGEIAAGRKRLVARDLTEPSPFALQVLNANPYAFLDDAPLEERRTQAINSRRWLDPATASDLGALDAAAIARVREEVWPAPRDGDELHEAMLLLGFVPDEELPRLDAAAGQTLSAALDALHAGGRLVRFNAPRPGWAATERVAELRALWPQPVFDAVPSAAEHFEGVAAGAPAAALEGLVRSRLEMIGPAGAAELAAWLNVTPAAMAQALAALVARGIVLGGHYDPEATSPQWCDRRLLARIHRYTLGRLRQEIEPVSSTDFMRFLLQWQHLVPGSQVSGAEGLYGIVAQLAGFEAPAAAWEAKLLPARLRGYQGSLLDELVRQGRCAWLRLTPKRSAGGGRQAGTLRNTPLALMPRGDMRAWLQVVGAGDGGTPRADTAAGRVLSHIETCGASFFDDIVAATGLLRTHCEAALDELAAAGVVTCDSFAGLRALTLPSARRGGGGRRTRRTTRGSLEEAGRWDRVRRTAPGATGRGYDEAAVEDVAHALLRRYGVVFRRLLERESALPPWREILWALRRMEAAGTLRGGRFVAGHSGEQFALPDAVGALRAARKAASDRRVVVVNATDPLNLSGVLLPGVRIPALEANALALVDGELAGVRTGNAFHLAAGLDAAAEVRVRTALVERTPDKTLPPRRRWR